MKETATFEDTVSQMDGSNATEDLDNREMQRGTLCSVGTAFNDVYHICTSMTGEKLHK